MKTIAKFFKIICEPFSSLDIPRGIEKIIKFLEKFKFVVYLIALAFTALVLYLMYYN